MNSTLRGTADTSLLPLVLDAIVPADEYPSSSASGGVSFLGTVLERDRPEWIDRLDAVLADIDRRATDRIEGGFAALDPDGRLAVLDELADDPEYRWLARLVTDGYYADPGNGGNRDAVSWSAVGWSPHGAGRLPDVPREYRAPDHVLTPQRVGARYDAVVIGSGAGGGVAAEALAASGRSVLVVESGDWPTTAELAGDHLRNPRSASGLDPRSGPPTAGNPRTVRIGGRTLRVGPAEHPWSNNAMTVGGGTRVYGAQAWRFTPDDLRMASRYGVPEGSALADWPIEYSDLEPFYSRAEWEIGVSGAQGGDPWAGERSRDYPMAPLPGSQFGTRLADAASRLGMSTLPVPLLINSRPYLGRDACEQCGQCVGFACAVDAKNGSQNTTLLRAFATGRCAILPGVRVERILTDAAGRVSGVALVAEVAGAVWRREVTAGEVVVSAGAVESARLLLASTSDREPNGLGNNADQVGRHLQGHVYAGALGVFDDEVVDSVGPGPSIATCDFRHGTPSIVGGGMLANEFVATPSSTFRHLVEAGVIPPHGAASKEGMRRLARRMQRVVGPIQEVTTASARVALDRDVRDRFGNPVAALSGGIHAEDVRCQGAMNDRAAEWLAAAGARRVVPAAAVSTSTGPSGGQHQAGTCRMGTDPASSVTDPYGRVWGHDNLRVADGSLHVTNGGVNPVLTIFANSMRVMEHMTR
ncbi:GMC family oxidoreductase [Planctomonas psychrotolerans]|uniref:GMC family oxidoreductase n=1 Tax=Planctomonas psychrotolerans TaxID=2528712 RepID=UPI001238B1DA|nr:GMC family oxidoreductase [Planctomonas psychrotolerans]